MALADPSGLRRTATGDTDEDEHGILKLKVIIKKKVVKERLFTLTNVFDFVLRITYGMLRSVVT